MDGKSIVTFLLIIGTICQSSWTIQIFPEQNHEEKLSELELGRIKDNVNLVEGSSRRYPALKSPRRNVDPSVDSREIVEEPPDHEIPYSEHENPKEVETKPKYVSPGEWAKPPVERNIPLDFVPTKLYAQVRGTHTVKHVPREEAIKDAETEEEKLNALRLREVVKNTKVNTVYTEEGYEDSAYDHAGHIRDADFHEGFARKLRDRLREKHEEGEDDLGELGDYEDDYSDENNEEDVKSNRLRSNIDPKSIVQNEIDVLASDVERNGEEVAGASDIHLFDSKKLKENAGSETKSNYQASEIEPEDTRIVEKQDKRYETTTLYNPVQETISDSSSRSPTEFDHYVTQPPTTLAYGQILWEFLKTKKSEPVKNEPTTSSPYVYQPTPISTMTVTLPGPYILPIQQETTTLPTIFSASQGYHTRGLDSDLVNAGLIASISQNNNQLWPLQTSPVNYIGRMDEDQTIPLTPASILNFQESWQPSVQGTLNRSIPDNYRDVEELGTTILPGEGTESDTNLTELNDNSNDYDDNPLLNPLLENTPEKKKKYRVLVRHKPQNTPKVLKTPRELDSKQPQKLLTQQDEFVGDQRAKYLKVLNYVTNQDRPKGPNDFAVFRAPVAPRPKEVRYFDFRPVDRPVGVDQSTVPIESETIMREPEIGKKLPWNRPISSLDHGFLGTSALPIYNIDRFPILDLSPPPLPLQPIRYRNNRYRPGTLSRNRKKQYRDIEPILKYAPVIVDLTRKSHDRRKRSIEYVKGEINNGTTNRPTRKRDYDRTVGVTKDGRRNTRIAEESNAGDFRESDTDYGKIERTFSRSRRGTRKTHEELLEDSPKVSGRVVDEEIEKRFNTNENDENDKRLEDVEKVKVDVADFDYVEELANQEDESTPTTTEVTVDVKKYPFYVNERIEDLSGLKYALDPRKVPRKTATGMEFYDSRDKYKSCEEVEANLEGVVPPEEKPSTNRGPNEDGPRLRNLGDKLDCFKAKYFDENPFDNPLFIEKNVGDPSLPKELDPKKLSERILVLPAAREESIFQKLSKKPEDRFIPPGRSNRKYNDQQIEINKKSVESYGSRTPSGHRRIPKRRPGKERVSSSFNFPPEPYQKQVYEDVMNHITNTNNPYRLPRPEVHVAAGTTALETPNGHLNELINKTNTTTIVSQANDTKIDGLLPPRGPNDFPRQNYPGRKRIIWKSRRRTPRYYAPRTITRYHAIKIQKRSVEKTRADDLTAEESETIPVTPRPRRRKFRIASQNLTSSTENGRIKDPEKEASSRIVYTIRDRFRHSKPKEELKNVGEFTTASSTLDEDTRRKEPRYNKIRRKPIKVDSSTDPTIISTIWTDESIAKESTTPATASNKRLEYSNLLRDKPAENLEEDSTKASNKYEVHEQVDDEIVTTVAPITSTSFEYSRVKDYLKSEAPGYEKAFPEETTESAVLEETRSKGSDDDSRETSKEDEEEDSEETTERSDESKEDISEKRQQDDHDEEEDEESNDSSEESEESKDEDRTFFHFSSRPYSPPENYEDEKYSDLGKRINKPSFYHPPFSMLGYERPSRLSRLEGSSEEDEDEDEEDSDENKKNSRFALHPSWAGETKGQGKSFGESKYYSRPFWSYEYPWEKREELAKGDGEKARERGRRTGKKSYGRFGDFREKDSDEDVSSSKRSSSRVYPWDLYDVPSRKYRKSRRERYFDVDGSASEHKPVKYSSKYNSSLLAPIKGANNSSDLEVDAKKMNKERDQSGSKKGYESTTVRRISSAGLVPEAITLSPIKDDGRKGRADERNSLEVASVATTDPKKRKNVTRKETRGEETNSSTQSSVENTSKSSITERTVDKSKRRRILKKYSQSNMDTVDRNNSTSPSEQVKRRRGKVRSTTVAPVTSTTTVSSTKPIRRKPQTLFKSKDTVPTASTTTVEHRSRVSKESFVRTTYPDHDNSTIDSDHGRDKFVDLDRNTNDDSDRNRGNITSENVESISVMTKETPDHVYRTKKIDKDGVKEMFVSITPNKAGNISELESDSTEFEKDDGEEEDEETEDDDHWKIPQEESEDLGGIPSSESKLVGNLSRRTLGQSNDSTELPEDEDDEDEEDEAEEEEKKNNIKIIRHPERRLYYYIERRR